MSAVGTKKTYGDEGVQMSFPYVFNENYDMPRNYFPSYQGLPPDLMIGTDLQAVYHEEKRADAVRNVMDGLQSRRTAQRLLMTGPHNYHLPKPVLGQRVFANPSMGAIELSSARRDRDGHKAPFRTIETDEGLYGSGMRGGVMKTREGYDYYKNNLANRVSQLNRINAVAQGYAVEMGQAYPTNDNKQNGGPDEVAFFLYLSFLNSAIIDGDITRFTMDNIKEIIQYFIRSAPTMEEADLNDVIESTGLGIQSLMNYSTQDYTVDPNKPAYVEILKLLLQKLFDFAKVVLTNVYASTNDKKRLVKDMIPLLRLDRWIKLDLNKFKENILQAERADNSTLDSRLEDFDGHWGGDEDDWGDDDGGGDGVYARPGVAREDADMPGVPRAPLAGRNSDPNRGRFGDRNGQLVYGESSYFGEESNTTNLNAMVQDRFPQVVAPLPYSGVDPNANGAPAIDATSLEEAVTSQIKTVLQDLGYVGSEDVDDFVRAKYPNPDNFVDEVSRGLEEKTFTKAQIAEGMRMEGSSVFADYIAENASSTDVPRASPARPAGYGGIPLGNLAPPIYRDAEPDGLADAPPVSEMAPRSRASSGRASNAESTRPATTLKGFPSKAQLTRVYRENNLPATRKEFLDNYNTLERIAELGARIPREYGGPYNPRADTKVRNAKARIVNIWKKNFDPDW